MRFATQIINFKKIGSKLWPWECARGRIQNGCRDVINYANELKLKRTQLDQWGTNLGKFGWNQTGCFAKRLVTDRQTHRQTHTQTDNFRFSGPQRSQYVQWMKMNECKNPKQPEIYVFRSHLLIWGSMVTMNMFFFFVKRWYMVNKIEIQTWYWKKSRRLWNV